MVVRRVVVAGCGGWGRNLVRNFSELGALAGVADPSATGRNEVWKLCGAVFVVETLEPFLADSSVGGVVVATPAETHRDLALAALRAGKDVMVEKPLGLSVQQAVELADAAQAAGRVLMVGHVLQYHPAFVKLRALVRAGELGQLRSVWLARLSLGKVRRYENVWWSFAPHDVSAALALFGERPVEVSCTGVACVQPGIVDQATCRLRMPSGGSAHIAVSWMHPVKEQRMTVIGSHAAAVFDDVRKTGKLQVVAARVEDGPDGPQAIRDGEPRDVPIPSDEPLRLECQHFLDRMADRALPWTDAQEGLAVVAVLSAAQQSMDQAGGPVKVVYG